MSILAFNLRHPIVRKRVCQGLLLSCGSPIGWFTIQLLLGAPAGRDLIDNPGIYAYLAIGTAMAFCLFAIHVGNYEHQLSQLTLIDPLTGAYNNRYFQQFFADEFALAKRSGKCLSAIAFDLDLFKRVNDQYGHLAGDEVLKNICSAVKQVCREGETLARVGGEEFCVILVDCEFDQALQAAERIRQAIAEVKTPCPGQSSISITASLGVAASSELEREQQQPLALYGAADEAMYRAKQLGRNRVEGYSGKK